MERPKFTKNINCTLREEMFLKIHEICVKKDISLSDFFREALKLKIKEESENGK